MIPLRDTRPLRSIPILTLITMAACAVIFLSEMALPAEGLAAWLNRAGLVPARLPLSHPGDLLAQPSLLLPFITNIFFHAGWLHFLVNMWFLFLFGSRVEERMGPGRWALFFLASGLAANLIHALTLPTSPRPAIGASGSIAALMAAYLIFFPRALLDTVTPIFKLPWLVRVPAVFFVGMWVLTQVYFGLSTLSLETGVQVGNVTWWAHTGGFLFGLAAGKAFAGS